MTSPRLLRALGAVVAVTVLGACQVETLGAPKGDLELVAVFEDKFDLAPGHSVQVADVTIGSVVGVDLDGYEARVTLSIEDGHPVPEGTVAVVSQTSLLGENYVELRYPPDAEELPELESGTVITDTIEEPPFELVTEEAIEIIGALAADDLAAVVDAGATGFGGRGEELGLFVNQFATVVGDLESSSGDIVAVIDGFARLSSDLADGSGEVTTLIDNLAGATGSLATNREALLSTLEDLTGLAQVTNDVVLEPHAERITQTIAQAAPLLTSVADSREELAGVISRLEAFTRLFPATVVDGEAYTYNWAAGAGPNPFDGSTFEGPPPPNPSEALANLLNPQVSGTQAAGG